MASVQIDNPGSLVAEAILKAESIGLASIVVDEFEGTITLRGIVESEQDRLIAEEIAQEQEGVVKVINNLRICVY